MHNYYCLLYLSTLLTFLSSSLSIRITSSNETDLAGTEVPDTGADPWDDIPCDFDDYSTCGWSNKHDIPDDFDWRLGEGKDSHKSRRRQKTGTKTDHGEGGGYMYISSGRWRNRTAKLATNFFKQTEPGCLKFWYHMRGRHMGHLKLYEFVTPQRVRYDPVRDVEKYQLLWSIYGNQGQWWKEGVVPISKISASYRRRLLFEAFDWDVGAAGNIVLDDISFDRMEGRSVCDFLPANAAPPTTTMASTTVAITMARTTTTTTQGTIRTSTAMANMQTETMFETYNTTESRLQKEPRPTSIVRNMSANEGVRIATATLSQRSAPVKSSQSSSITATFPAAAATATEEDGVSSKSDDNYPIYIAVGVVCTVLVLVVALALYHRHKKRSGFTYYNSSVHMIRMSPEIADPKETVMQYYKLT